jgi:hypothetical protein
MQILGLNTPHSSFIHPSVFCSAQVPESLRQNTRYNQRYVNPGANFVMLNGMLMEVKNFELYSECRAQDSSMQQVSATWVCTVGWRHFIIWSKHTLHLHTQQTMSGARSFVCN